MPHVNKIKLWWERQTRKQSLKLDPNDSNVEMMYLSPRDGKRQCLLLSSVDNGANDTNPVTCKGMVMTDNEQSNKLDDEGR